MIEQEPARRSVIADTLSAANDVVEAAGGSRALSLLASGPPFAVVVVGSLGFGKRAGRPAWVELVRTMFRRWPWMPVVIIGQVAPRLKAELLLTGVRDVLPKGLAPADLARSIAAVARQPEPVAPSPGRVATINRILAFLDGHVGEGHTLRQLAAMAAMSRSHFSRMFHAVAGLPLRDYLRDLRLKRAHQLMLTSRLSLTDVAAEVGFYDLPHFDKTFRQRLGLSPYDFRARQTSAPRRPPTAASPARPAHGHRRAG